MTVKNIALHNFRNYGWLHIDFSENMNILYGENAQGKTNILEAIFLCSTGRSHRTQKDAEMIKFGEDAATVALEMERKNYGIFRIEIEIQRSGRKSIKINGVPQKRAGDLLGRLNCAIFSPEDLAIIKNEPQLRRRFLDMFISQIKPSYYFNLHSYLGALRQRNTLLRQSKENRGLLDTVGAWDYQLAEFGAKVMRERFYFIKQIGACAKENHSRITDGGEDLDVAYDLSLKFNSGGIAGVGGGGVGGSGGNVGEAGGGGNGEAGGGINRSSVGEAGGSNFTGGGSGNGEGAGGNFTVGGSGLPSEASIKDAFLQALEQGLQSDIMRMSTQCGPHKDDIACTIGGRNVRLFGSQGQQRTAALALKMSQIDVMAREVGDIPVLLLDDVMSELDRGRRGNISANMKGAQVFITGTDMYRPDADRVLYTTGDAGLCTTGDAGSCATGDAGLCAAGDAVLCAAEAPDICYFRVNGGSAVLVQQD